MSILLIRHAETAANASRTVQTPDVPLNERGIEQSERLGRRLARGRIGLILTSDYERAAHTARAIARFTGTPIEYDEDLRERNYGDIRGKLYAEVGADIFARDYAPPNGETWDQFLVRVARVWQRICSRAAGTDAPIAVVTHGLVCQAIGQNHLLLESDAPLAPRGFANTSLTIVDARPPYSVRLLNCSAHLTDAAPARGISGI
jgi:probable phosphoglycerate mutase